MLTLLSPSPSANGTGWLSFNMAGMPLDFKPHRSFEEQLGILLSRGMRIAEPEQALRFENFRLGTSLERGTPPHAIWQVVLAMSCGAAQGDHAAGNVGGIRQHFRT